MNSKYTIRNFTQSDLQQVKEFTDRWIGEGYFEKDELKTVLDLSQKDGLNCSLLAFADNEITAVRLSYAPGLWIGEKTRGLTPKKWNTPAVNVAYFKSLFVHQDHQGSGLGKYLSRESIKILEQMGAKAILCHSWKESPNNSSMRYLGAMGFKVVEEHKEFWKPIDYLCTRCTPSPCICTAAEMIFYIEDEL